MDIRQRKGYLFSDRTLIAMLIPLVLDALLTIAAGVVDSAMVSSAGEAAVSAVSLVDSLCLLFITFSNAISIGGGVVTSQYLGKRNYERAGVSANQIFYAAVSVSTFFMILVLPIREWVLELVYGRVEADVFENASIYFFYILLGFPFFAMGAASAAVLRSMGKNRQAATATIAYNLLNVVGNAILIYGCKMGVAGAAISTTLSRICYAILGLYLAHRKELPARFHKLWRLRVDFDIMGRVLKVGMTQGVENGLIHFSKILIASLVSSLGTAAIAANSVSFSINNVGWTVINAFSTVALTVVGQCIGAGEHDQARYYTKRITAAASVTAVFLFGSIFLLRNQLVLLFDFAPENLAICARYTGIGALCAACSCCAVAFVPVSAFRAAGDIRYAMAVSVGSVVVFRLGLCYLLHALFPGLGLLCAYLGMFMEWVCRSSINVLWYRRGKWLRKKLI